MKDIAYPPFDTNLKYNSAITKKLKIKTTILESALSFLESRVLFFAQTTTMIANNINITPPATPAITPAVNDCLVRGPSNKYCRLY